MSGDRELLELAAKAAGYDGVRPATFGADCWMALIEGEWQPWNPLTDDGDALRLLTKLRLCLIPLDGGGWDVERYDEHGEGRTLAACTKGNDAMVRECIVRAAAEIGRTK